MIELKGFYNLLIRGTDLTAEEQQYIENIYNEYGRDMLYSMVKGKKILPFAARTFANYGFDMDFWIEIQEDYRKRNSNILNCLEKVYQALRQFGVIKMFVSENFGALLSADEDISLFASGDVDNYADPAEKEKIYMAFDSIGFARQERFSGQHLIAAEFFPPENTDLPEGFYVSVDFYPLARLKLPCFIEADKFVDWDNLIKYKDTNVVLPPHEALMYICLLHISLHSFSRAPDIRLYIDLLNMNKTNMNYEVIRQWCIRDKTCTRAAAAASLSNMLVKTKIPDLITGLSKRKTYIEKIVYNRKHNDLIYEPKGLKVLRLETLCNDSGSLRGLKEILFPNRDWMKQVYGSSGLSAQLRHFIKVV